MMMAAGEVDDKKGSKHYPWAVLTDPNGSHLFIIARDMKEFRDRHEDAVLRVVKDKGFVHMTNKPIKTYSISNNS